MRALFLIGLSACALSAQQAPTLSVAASGRATTEVSMSPPGVRGQPEPAPLRIRIDYGQPHARGRQLLGQVIPFDTVWRTGANTATTLTTDVPLVLGGTTLPKGAYSLFTLPTKSGWTLIVNADTGQSGTDYATARDVVRIPLTARTLKEPVESFSIVLQPEAKPPVRGVLRLAWGDFELSAPWSVKP
jgi:hypothetical protein